MSGFTAWNLARRLVVGMGCFLMLLAQAAGDEAWVERRHAGMGFETPADWEVQYSQADGVLLGKGDPSTPEGAALLGFGWEEDVGPIFEALHERGMQVEAIEPQTLGGVAYERWSITGGESGVPTAMFQLASPEQRADGKRLMIQYGRFGAESLGDQGPVFDRILRSLHPLEAGEDGPSADAEAVTAATLFAEISALDNWDLEAMEALYKRVMTEFPDTDQAQESYWRLTNMYILAFEPQRWADAAALLEAYKARYPGSNYLDERFAAFASNDISLVDEKLLRIYDELDRPAAADAIYVTFLTDPAELDEERKEYAPGRATVLEKLGRNAEAIAWLRAWLALDHDPDDFMARVVQGDLARLEAMVAGDVEEADVASQPTPAELAEPPSAAPQPEEPPGETPVDAEAAAAGAHSPAEQAQIYREEAQQSQADGDYADALRGYRESLKLQPDPVIEERVRKLEAYLGAKAGSGE